MDILGQFNISVMRSITIVSKTILSQKYKVHLKIIYSTNYIPNSMHISETSIQHYSLPQIVGMSFLLVSSFYQCTNILGPLNCALKG